MKLLQALRGRPGAARPPRAVPVLEVLETRTLPAVTSALASGLLTITGGPERTDIRVLLDAAQGDLVVYDHGLETARFASADVTAINIDGSAGSRDIIIIDKAV